MSLPTSRLAYSDVFDIFDKALGDPHGIRIPFRDRGKASYYRMRMNYGRTIDRADNREIYERGHPMHGRSPYDHLLTTLREVDGVWYIYVIPMLDASRMEIESLEGLDPDPPQAKLTIIEPPRQTLAVKVQ